MSVLAYSVRDIVFDDVPGVFVVDQRIVNVVSEYVVLHNPAVAALLQYQAGLVLKARNSQATELLLVDPESSSR